MPRFWNNNDTSVVGNTGGYARDRHGRNSRSKHNA
jgi:hypothetical protein